MAGGNGEGGGGEAVVELDDAVKLLVEHLVQPVLPRHAYRREEALVTEKQETVARQVHATVLLYNYFHRKQFPQLDFADANRFAVSASLAAGEPLLVYLNQVHDRGASGEEAGLSVTDKAIVDACGIAEALDATRDAPETITWPISRVAVLLIDKTRKRCLIEHGAVIQGVWSIPEKDVTTASGSTDLSSSEALPSEPFMLQQTAYSLVESKTGMKHTSLRFLEEQQVYSLSQKERTTKLFVLQFDQTVNTNLKEVSLQHLINRMSGPIFTSDPYLITTSVVECYHLLPYKEVLLNLLNRGSCLDSSQGAPKEQPLRKEKSSLHSEIDESLKGQEANSMSNTKKMAPNSSVSKKNKLVVKEVGNNDINNCITSKHRKNSSLNSKRKSEAIDASPATSTEHRDGETLRKGNDSLSIPDVETLKFVSNSANAEATRVKSRGFLNLEASVQMDNNRTENHNAQEVDPISKNHASEHQTVRDTKISGSVTGNMNDQMYASLQSLQKMRDDILREHCVLGDRSAQLDVDIQTILTEGEMTSRVMSILRRYETNNLNVMQVVNPTNSREGSQTMKRKRKKLTEAILLRNKCQELDEICRENNWILPRYAVLPSAIDGLYQASVHLVCPDLKMSADGDTKTTPREARDSAAANLLYQLHIKAKEKISEGRSMPDAALHDVTPEN